MTSSEVKEIHEVIGALKRIKHSAEFNGIEPISVEDVARMDVWIKQAEDLLFEALEREATKRELLDLLGLTPEEIGE